MYTNTEPRITIIAVLVSGLAIGCQPATDAPPASGAAGSQIARVSAYTLRQGAAVYAKNCAACHGARAEGAKDWHRPGADGKYPPPPLDGSAHAWHHPRVQLKQIVLDGTQPRGGMPAWRGKLSDAEVDAVIDWFQSLWPPEIYRAWLEIDRQAR